MQASYRQLFFVCAIVLATAVAIWPGAAAATEYEVVPVKVETAPWAAALPSKGKPPAKRHTVTLRIFSGYCLGEPKPEVHHVKVIEQPQTSQHSFKSAVITAYVVHPEYERPVQPPNTEHVVYNACAGVGFVLDKRIKLKRPVADLRLFDGSFSPPRKVWPALSSS